MGMRIPIRAKLIVAILVPLGAVYIGVLVLDFYSGRRQAVRLAQTHLAQLAANHAARLDAMFTSAEQAAVNVAGAVAEQPGAKLPGLADGLLARNVLKSPLLEGACVAMEPNAVPGVEHYGRYVARPAPPPAATPEARAAPKGKARRAAGSAGQPAASRPAEPPDVGDWPGPPPPPPGEPPAPPIGRADGPRAGLLRPGSMDVRMPALRRGQLADVDEEFFRSRWYLDVKNRRKPVWFEVVRERTPYGIPVCRCAVPVMRDDVFVGAVAFDVNLAPVQRYVANTPVEGGYCMLVAASGLLIAHPQKGLALKESLNDLAENRKLPDLAALAEEMRAGHSGAAAVEDFRTLADSYVGYAPVSPVGWSLAAVEPVEHILAPVKEWFRRDMAVMLGGLGFIIMVVMLVSIRITQPIGRLAQAARELAKGNLHVRVRGVRNNDELGELASAFNGMVRSLDRHVEALTRETAARKAVESELRVARDIQASLLPRALPVQREFDLFAMNVPAKEVAGDFFDFFFLGPDVLALLIADVSGKGIPAALFMAMTRTVLRNQAVGGAPPAEVLNRANRLIITDNERTMFVTLFLAHYHVHTGKLVYANAGHNPPCIGAADGKVRRLDGSTGTILGVFENQVYTQKETHLLMRDRLVLYTDGITEAMDASDRMFQLDHLERIVAGNPTASPEELCGLVVQSVQNYRAYPQQDDVTMMVLRRNE
jgi:sigma-B regulation protein RsbU (phosphoserine phosphatase)